MNISLHERHHAQAIYQAEQVATFLRDNPDSNLHRTVTSKLPGDELSLRGIPCLARGVGGAIGGSRPEGICNR